MLPFPLRRVRVVIRSVMFRIHRSHCRPFVAILVFIKWHLLEFVKHVLRRTSVKSENASGLGLDSLIEALSCVFCKGSGLHLSERDKWRVTPRFWCVCSESSELVVQNA